MHLPTLVLACLPSILIFVVFPSGAITHLALIVSLRFGPQARISAMESMTMVFTSDFLSSGPASAGAAETQATRRRMGVIRLMETTYRLQPDKEDPGRRSTDGCDVSNAIYAVHAPVLFIS